jgi:long-chain acyl-CoA synthetase
MTPKLPMIRYPARTLPAMAEHSARRVPNRVFIRFLEPARPDAPPRELTFAGFRAGIRRATAFLRAAGVGAGDRVLLVAENSPEWQMVALGAQLLRAEPAGVFASLSAESTGAIARRVRPRVALLSAAAWEKLAPVAADLVASGLAAVILAEGAPQGAPPAGARVVSLAEVTGEGVPALPEAEAASLAAAVSAEDPFLLVFTSGTTGRPKGVRLPQRTMVHAVEGGTVATGVTEADLGLHFLPFAHVAGHAQFTLALAQGHGLVMVARREDIERGLTLHPTYVFSVPLVYERIRGAVEARVDRLPGPLRRLARASLEAAGRVRVDGSRRGADRVLTGIADRLLGRAVRARLGGRIRGLFAGGAPPSQALFRFFEALGIPMVELYGMSETAGLISSNLFAGERRAGSAGLLTPDHEVRFAEDGELQVRGPLLFSGYLEPEDGEEAYTADGFFRTGDLGRLDADGLLQIDGRKKSVMVLSTGKKVSPEPIEQVIASTRPFEGAVLLGEGRPFVAAVVFVAKEELARLAAAGTDAAEALLPRVRDALSAFSDFEKPKRLLVIAGAPQDHPALVTPTLKLKRDALLASLGPSLSSVYGASERR